MADEDPKIATSARHTLYDADFAAWIGHQVDALRTGRFDELDIEELADEVESLAKRDFKKLRSAFRIVIQHMLKWDYQPERRGEPWRRSINEHRDRIWGELASSPTFRPRVPEAIEQAYPLARTKAWSETGVFKLEREPKICPYSFDEIMYREHQLDPDCVPVNEDDPDQGGVDFD